MGDTRRHSSEKEGAAPAIKPRDTATFEPYYWEAYNEIVHPSRFDWYLIARWLPDLGPEGFAILKVLRNLCFFNPKEGILRNECDIAMSNLATAAGMTERTLYRHLKENEALSQFVRRQARYVVPTDGAPHRASNRFIVCMDDPIHPEDRQRYEALRRQRDMERGKQQTSTVIIERACQNGRHRSAMPAKSGPYACQNGGHIGAYDCHFGRANKDRIPPEEFILKKNTPSAGSPLIDSPQGEGEQVSPDPLQKAWEKALLTLKEQVSKPTFETHLRTLTPLSVSNADEVTLAVPSPFTREWIEKRHASQIQTALTAALGRDVTVHLTVQKTGPAKPARVAETKQAD